MSGFRSFIKDLHSVLAFADDLFGYTLDIYSFSGVLSKLKICVVFIQKIDYLLIVDLQKRASNDKIDSIFSLPLDTLEQKL